ncbi:outer membrane channel protein [Lacunisphaera limnophila]|uniref:Outer membrane channel protein n=1 Tax=Lacunisphaera limnophila TaxID=1838286 RepID=A0A1D8AWI5_9BACT|nr:TolC family protein [Lacunisphaera limnophila]AOS45241.1 outer membrane channel protein [Lacunisphaera limnophila]
MTQLLRRLTASSLAALLLCSAARAQDSVPTSVPGATTEAAGPELTLEQCIARALQKNFDLEISRFAPQIAQDSIVVARGGFEPQLSVTGSTGENTAPGFESKDTDLRVGVTQRLQTGTTVSASSRLNRSSSDPAPLLNPAYAADLTLSVRQSLLNGAGLAINRAGIERAEIGFARANLEYKARVLDIIQDTENAYYNLAYAREQLAVRNFSLTLANKLLDEAKTRRDTGVATDLDVLQAEVGVANAHRSVILAEQSVKDRQDGLLALIGQFELDAALGTVRFKEVTAAAPVFASSYAMAKQNQPDYLSSQAAIEQFRIDLKLAKDAARPDLTVGAALGLSGTNGSTSDAFGDAFDRQNKAWQVDFAFNYPWGQKSDRARERQSLAALSREQSRLRQTEQTIELQVRSAVRSVETNLESVKIASLASALSQKQYELEKAKFDAGLSTSRRVLEAQDDLESARVNELQAKATLHTAIAALHRIEGSSLQRYAVELP